MTMKAKKSTNKKSNVNQPVMCSQPKSVSIEKADNGFTISTYTDKGRKQLIAKNESEALRHAKELLK